jgi:hypothetical protein
LNKYLLFRVHIIFTVSKNNKHMIALLTSQRNTIFSHLKNNGFENPINDFQLGQNATELILTYKRIPEYRVVMSDANSRMRVQFFPFNNAPTHSMVVEKKDFNSIVDMISLWLKYLKPQLVPDLWTSILDNVSSYDSGLTYDSDIHYDVAKSAINHIESKLDSIGLLPEQIKMISEKLDSIPELIKNNKNFDWQSFIYGTVVSMICSMFIGKEEGVKLLELAKESIQFAMQSFQILPN